MDWQNYKTAKLDDVKLEYLDKYSYGKSLLDVGTATGIYANYLTKKGFSVTAIDSDDKMLKQAKSKYKNINFKKINVEKLILKQKFDTSIVFDLLEHVDDKATIKKIARTTNKVIIGCVPRTTDESLLKNYLLFRHHQDTTHLRTYTIESLKKLFSEIEYKKVVIRKSHPISTDNLIIDLLDGDIFIKKILRKILFLFTSPKEFHSNLMFVVYLK